MLYKQDLNPNLGRFGRWVVRGSLLVLVLAVIRSTAAVPTAYEDATNSPKPDLIVYALI